MSDTQLQATGLDIAEIMASVIAQTQAADFKSRVITGDEVEFHDGPKIGIPKGMTYAKAKKVLTRLEEEAETVVLFERHFRYRPDDGAYAAYQVIKAKYGMALGKSTWFQDAESRTINIGVNQTMQVPWGLLEIPVFEGLELYVTDVMDKDYGTIFRCYARGPRKYKEEIEEFFDAIADYLRDHSIYRGQAIVGSSAPEFLDLSVFDPTKIVFSDEVTAILDGTLFAPLRYTDTMRREGISLKRAALLTGPYGTGKTSIGQMMAQIATENGWTFISARPGREKVEDVLRTARLYQPAVVFIEDIDGEANDADPNTVTRLLEAFDGITSKGGELQIIMTTNHLDRIHKGMLRPGRLDAVVEIAGLDRNGTERLIRAVVDPAKLDPRCDFDAVYDAMQGFLPAFVREVVTRAVTFSINRLGGQRAYTIGTDDLVGAAHSLRPQLAALNDANEGERRPTLDTAFTDVFKDAAKHLGTADSHHEHFRVVELDDDGDVIED